MIGENTKFRGHSSGLSTGLCSSSNSNPAGAGGCAVMWVSKQHGLPCPSSTSSSTPQQDLLVPRPRKPGNFNGARLSRCTGKARGLVGTTRIPQKHELSLERMSGCTKGLYLTENQTKQLCRHSSEPTTYIHLKLHRSTPSSGRNLWAIWPPGSLKIQHPTRFCGL